MFSNVTQDALHEPCFRFFTRLSVCLSVRLYVCPSVCLSSFFFPQAVQWNRLLRQQLTEEEAQLAEARARNKPAWMPKMLSRRSFNSSSSSRHGMTDSRRAPRPAVNPTPDRWGGGVGVNAPASGSYANNSVQRPVEIANPMRQAR